MSGVSNDPEAAAGSGGTSRVSKSATMAYPQNAGSSQAPATNTGVGNATTIGGEKQTSDGDRKVTDTAMAHVDTEKINVVIRGSSTILAKLEASTTKRNTVDMSRLKNAFKVQNEIISTLLTNMSHLKKASLFTTFP